MEILYHDLKLTVTSAFNESLQLLIRVKNYVREEQYAIVHVPIIVEENGNSTGSCPHRLKLNEYCKQLIVHF